MYYRSIFADLYLSWHKKNKTLKVYLSMFLETGIVLASIAFCFLLISKPLQVISSYNKRDRIRDVKFWHLFLKSLPSISILKEVPSRKRHEIKIKSFLSKDIRILKWITPIVDVKLPPWKIQCSSEKLYERFSLLHSNKYFYTCHSNTIKNFYYLLLNEF